MPSVWMEGFMLQPLRNCNKCKRYLPFEQFYEDKRGKGYLTRKCKVCHSQDSYNSRKKRNAVRDNRADYDFAIRLRLKYGLTMEAYNDMLIAQGGGCDICGAPPLPNKRLGVDHDHATGKVRGLLCSKCNVAIGFLGESVDTMLSAIAYIEKHHAACCEG